MRNLMNSEGPNYVADEWMSECLIWKTESIVDFRDEPAIEVFFFSFFLLRPEPCGLYLS